MISLNYSVVKKSTPQAEAIEEFNAVSDRFKLWLTVIATRNEYQGPQQLIAKSYACN